MRTAEQEENISILREISYRPGVAAPPHQSCCRSCSQFQVRVWGGWPGSSPGQRPCPWFSGWNWVQWLRSAPRCHRHHRHRQLRGLQLPTCHRPWCRRLGSSHGCGALAKARRASHLLVAPGFPNEAPIDQHIDLTSSVVFFEGSLEVKLPTIWRDEKQSRAGRLEERRSEEKE